MGRFGSSEMSEVDRKLIQKLMEKVRIENGRRVMRGEKPKTRFVFTKRRKN